MCQVLAKHPDTNPDPDPKPNQVLAKHPPVFKACLRDVADRLDDHEAYVRLFAAQLLEPISANELRPHTADFKKRRSLLKTRRLRPRPPGLSGGHFQHQVVLQTSRASVGLGPSAALGRAGRPYRPLFSRTGGSTTTTSTCARSRRPSWPGWALCEQAVNNVFRHSAQW